ncbi:CYTH and CHAD domain-containing protein [Novosphingobium clariflavum]|uniref:CHAD domain-containing protein n=1 Tax=Novosphingobium clariflavum TaxID=2029884 RepID=A0ABV6S729_9SPHN|nr:CHAD domain-containing protein [Novosphingobium clariflavum]
MADTSALEEELKLELSPYDADLLADLLTDLLADCGLAGGAPRLVSQESTYFDTPDHALARAGLSLRVRRSGRRHKQTIKADGSAAGMLVRSEWEREIAGNQPVLDDDNPVTALLGHRTALLAPVFVVENERRVWNRDGIEIALDQGRIVAGERLAPLCEVELERKGAALDALFALAREIEARVPARICVLSKAERGYRLLAAAAPAPKAGRIRLTPQMSVADSLALIVGHCLGHFHRNLPALLDHGDAHALHQARVAIRRLRSALSLYRPVVRDPRKVARFQRDLQWLAGKLGAMREIDVLLANDDDPEALAPLCAARRKAAGEAAAALRSKRCRLLMLDLAEWIAIGRWRRAAPEAAPGELSLGAFAAAVLTRRRKILRKRGRHLAGLGDEARHDVRKAAKKLRYAADFFAALYPQEREGRRARRFVARVERLQERLGTLNDRVTAPAVRARLGLAPRRGPTADAEKAEQAEQAEQARLLRAAAKDYDEFATARPFWR